MRRVLPLLASFCLPLRWWTRAAPIIVQQEAGRLSAGSALAAGGSRGAGHAVVAGSLLAKGVLVAPLLALPSAAEGGGTQYGAVLAADAAAAEVLAPARLALVGVLRPGASRLPGRTIAEPDVRRRTIHADLIADARVTAIPAADVADAAAVAKTLANTLVRLFADALVRVRITDEVAISSAAIEVTTAGIRAARAYPIAAVTLAGAAGRGDALSPAAALVAGARPPALPAVGVVGLRIDAEVAAADLRGRAGAGAAAAHAGHPSAAAVAAASAVEGVGLGVDAGLAARDRAPLASLFLLLFLVGGYAARLLRFRVGVSLVPLSLRVGVTPVALPSLRVGVEAEKPGDRAEQAAHGSSPRTHAARDVVESVVVHGSLQTGSGKRPELDSREKQDLAHR